MPHAVLPHDLNLRLKTLVRPTPARPIETFTLGIAALDQRVGQALAQAGVHEIYAASTLQAVTANGFGLGLGLRASRSSLIWISDDRGRHEAGALSGAGLHEWGMEPDNLLLIRVSSAQALLAAGEDALRSGAADAVLLSGWGEARAFSLTASRRLALAAAQGGTTAVVIRAGAAPQPSAAETRWVVAAAPSTALEARAPGRPAFRVSLLRSRAGAARGEWIMEWDRENRSFVEPKASGGLVPVSARRTAGVRAA